MKRKIKIILYLTGLFLLSSLAAVGFEEYYRILIRQIFNLVNDDRFIFFGKNFHLFPSYLFCFGFGLFVVFLTVLTYRQRKQTNIQKLLLTIMLFFVTTLITSLIDSKNKMRSCITCQEGQMKLSYNASDYDTHFIISLVVALAPCLLTFKSRKTSEEGLQQKVFRKTSQGN